MLFFKKAVEMETIFDKCPECGNQNLIYDYDSGEIVCNKCGLILEERKMIKTPEWRAYTLEEIEKNTRTGLPFSFASSDKGLSTTMRYFDRDAHGGKLSTPPYKMRWLKKLHDRSKTWNNIERNLVLAMPELERLSDKLNISKPVKEQAAFIYRKALKENLVKGRSIDEMVAASLYVACRIHRIPKSLKEISKISSVPMRCLRRKYKNSRGRGRTRKYKSISRCYRLLLRELDLPMPVPNSSDYISKIAEKIGISGKTQGLAVRILHRARKKRIHLSKDPRSIAAALLYIACLKNVEKRTQDEIAKAAGVTEVTIRTRYKELTKKLELSLK